MPKIVVSDHEPLEVEFLDEKFDIRSKVLLALEADPSDPTGLTPRIVIGAEGVKTNIRGGVGNVLLDGVAIADALADDVTITVTEGGKLQVSGGGGGGGAGDDTRLNFITNSGLDVTMGATRTHSDVRTDFDNMVGTIADGTVDGQTVTFYVQGSATRGFKVLGNIIVNGNSLNQGGYVGGYVLMLQSTGTHRSSCQLRWTTTNGGAWMVETISGDSSTATAGEQPE